MRSYIPSKRHKILDIVLQYDTEKKELGKTGFLSDAQRFSINQERARIMRDDYSFSQTETLENQITSIVLKIRSDTLWQPQKTIQYQ